MAGRPTKYTTDIADDICTRLADGESLRSICRLDHIPVEISTVRDWVAKDVEGFSAQYAHARELQGEHYAFKVLDVCEKVSTEELRPDQGRVINDGYKWMAGKLNGKYSDKIIQEQTGPGGGPIKYENTSDDALDARIKELTGKS